MRIYVLFQFIMLAVVSVRKVKPVATENIIEGREKCPKETVATAKLDNICLADETERPPGMNYRSMNGQTEKDPETCPAFKQNGEQESTSGVVDMDLDLSDSDEPNDSTLALANKLKEKLNWIRWTDYSYYGTELRRTNKLRSIQDELLTVVTYNVLSQTLLEKHRYLYKKHDNRTLNWNTRSRILLDELSTFNADILCLQEVDFSQVDSFYNRHLNRMGYQGVYKQRTHDKVDGCAIYFKSNKFNLIESTSVEFFKESVRLLDRDNIGVILKLSMKNRPEVQFVVATTHLLYNPKRGDIKLAQTQLMLAEMEKIAYKKYNALTQQHEYLPIVYTGDMNYSPNSAIYQLITKSHFIYEGTSSKFLRPVQDGFTLNKTLLPSSVGITDSCQYASSLSKREGRSELHFETGALDHPLNLRSVYDHVKYDLPEATTNQDEWLTVDYIFYSQKPRNPITYHSTGDLKLVSKLTLPNSDEAEYELRRLPNFACASDHLPLFATFHLSTN